MSKTKEHIMKMNHYTKVINGEQIESKNCNNFLTLFLKRNPNATIEEAFKAGFIYGRKGRMYV